jgi:simple sugar transport system permease protein
MSGRLRALLGQALAVVFAIALGSIVIIVVGESPVRIFSTLVRGAFGDAARTAGTLLQTTPILVSGVAACISFRGGLFNIGIEGQLFAGGFAAVLVGLYLPLPPFLHVLAGLVAAIAAGLAWIAIPALFRARYHANEVVSTILSNYVAVLVTSYLTIFIFKRPGGWSETPPILPSAHLPELFAFSRLNWGLVIGVVLAIAAQLYFRYSPRGYAITIMGQNVKFAEYAGVDLRRGEAPNARIATAVDADRFFALLYGLLRD